MRDKKIYTCAVAALASLYLPGTHAFGQTATEEIIVTARKRVETSIATPVILSAMNRAELERRSIVSLDVLSRSIPQLQIGDAAGGVQGGTVSIRGISAGEQNPFIDQAVTFNIDGAPIAVAGPRRMAQMDMAQVEVLKGPQALYYGKNSPGGVISITTADPGDSFEAKGSVGYEFYAQEVRGDAYISGPVTEKFGLRLAGYATTMRGWNENIGPQQGVFGPKEKWGPGTKEFAGRVTAIFRPSDQFSARLKLSYSHMRDNGGISATETYFCPTGVPDNSTVGDCQLNHKFVRTDLGPYVSELEKKYAPNAKNYFGSGEPIVAQNQFLGSLQTNYNLTDHLEFSSVTSWYDNWMTLRDQFTWTDNIARQLASVNHTRFRFGSQEFRLASSFESPLNFMLGVHGEITDLQYNVRSSTTNTPANPAVGLFGLDPALPVSATNPTMTRDNDHEQRGTALSYFGELTYAVTKTIEISGGARYSSEKKHYRGWNFGVEQLGLFGPNGKWSNFSPEATVRWRPSDTLTFFGSYKRGFLSGGFNSGSGTFGSTVANDRRYGQEIVKGWEIGAKSLMFDRTVRMNLGIYDYKISGLQVSTIIQFPALGTTAQVVNNAGAAEIKGVEYDATWSTPVDGLDLRGAFGYNHGRYKEFKPTCYVGQSKAAGCNLTATGPAGAGTGTLQDLAGQQLGRAPDWTASVGATFARPITPKLTAELGADAAYSSKFFSNSNNNPFAIMPSYWLFDATLRVFSPESGWEIAFIGRNLADKIYYTRSTDIPFTPGAGSGTGTNAAFLGDIEGSLGRGREVWVRVSKKIGG